MRTLCRLALALTAPLIAADPSVADNDANSRPLHLATDGMTIQESIGTGTPNRWYVTTLKAGRSYEFRIQPVNTDATTNGWVGMALFQEDGTTPLPFYFHPMDSSPQTYSSPAVAGGLPIGGDRVVYTTTADKTVLMRTGGGFTGGTFITYRISVQETSIFCPWYFTSANYDSFVQVQNTTSFGVLFSLQFFGFVASSGDNGPVAAKVGYPVNFVLPAFGSTFIAAKGGGTVPVGSSGGATITHNGPAGAIKANVTTVNTTGVGLTHSFNVFCTRQIDQQTPLAQ
jgi:hypothetical protein